MNHRDAPPLGIPAMSRWMRLTPILVVGCTPAAVAEPAIVGEEVLLAEIPTVVSATRLPQPQVHTPISTTLITREMIEASGFTEIADIFRLVPGFQVAQATGGHYVVAYHGQERTFPDRIEVMVDGRSVYGNLISTVTWKTLGIALEDIERIEVVRGANAPVFGANAFSATINITTRAPFASHGTWLDTTLGSQDTAKVTVRHAGSHGDFDYRVTASYRTDSGFEPAPGTAVDSDRSRLADFSLRAFYAPDRRHDLDLQLGYSGGELASLYPGNEPFLSHHDGDTRSHYQSLRWTRRSAPGHENTLQLYHNYQNQSDTFDGGPLSAILGVPPRVIPAIFPGQSDQTIEYFYADGISERYDLEWQQTRPLDTETRIAWGGGLRLDRLSSPNLGRDGFIDDRSARLFANVEHALSGPITLNAGLIAEHTDTSALFGSARLAVNYRLSPERSLRASLSHTRRDPSILEENWDAVLRFRDGTPLMHAIVSLGDLDVERSTVFETGYAAAYLQGKLYTDTKLFWEDVSDLIDLPRYGSERQNPTTGLPDIVVINATEYHTRGIEGQVRYQFAPRSFVSLQFCLAESNRDRLRIYRPNVRRSIDNATPQQTLSLLAAHHLGNGWQGSLGYYRMSRTFWLGDGDEVDSYDRVDLRLAKDLLFADVRTRVELVAQNVGEAYTEYKNGRNLFNTRYYVKLSAAF